MDVKMTATQAGDEANMENGIEKNSQMEERASIVVPFNQNIIPDVIGGQDFTSLRPQMDPLDQNIILASCRELLYYRVETVQRLIRATINQSKLHEDEIIVACERFDNIIYLFTNYGNMFLWNHDTKDWHNELCLHLKSDERLISCKLMSKRQYIFSVESNESPPKKLYYSMSLSEREKPKSRESIGTIDDGLQTSFDIGTLYDPDRQIHSSYKNEQVKRRVITYIDGQDIHFRTGCQGRKLRPFGSKQKVNEKFVCVRACQRKPYVAAGDVRGRIYLYTGNFEDQINRVKLHWHSIAVSDLCFSSTGLTLFSVGGESGCVVVWDLSANNMGQKHVIARLGLPIRNLNCGSSENQLVLGFEDNEIQILNTSSKSITLPNMTRRGLDIYTENNHRALRFDVGSTPKSMLESPPWMLWHSVSDTVVTNSKPGYLQFYSPKSGLIMNNFNFLKCRTLSLENDGSVRPSDLVKVAFSIDGHWVAFHEATKPNLMSSDFKLQIWQKSPTRLSDWTWIQTADRIHSDTTVVDLQFSPDCQFLASLSEDGSYHILHRVNLDSKSTSKQIYAKGFTGKVPKGLASMIAFSQDSSVMAISLKNDTTTIWMIVDPYKLVFECQLSQVDVDMEINNAVDDMKPIIGEHTVLGLRFGRNLSNQANLCEVRSRVVRIWNILHPDDMIEYSVNNLAPTDEFKAVAFDQSFATQGSRDHFAVATKSNQVLLFCLEFSSNSRNLNPLVTIDVSTPFSRPKSLFNFTSMCFLNNPILDVDPKCDGNPTVVRLLSRLCMMNERQELLALSDKLTLARQQSGNSCNSIDTINLGALHAYFIRSETAYKDEIKNPEDSTKLNPKTITQKQKQIKNRLEVKRVMSELLRRIPSHNLPVMEVLGPMILDKLI